MSPVMPSLKLTRSLQCSKTVTAVTCGRRAIVLMVPTSADTARVLARHRSVPAFPQVRLVISGPGPDQLVPASAETAPDHLEGGDADLRFVVAVDRMEMRRGVLFRRDVHEDLDAVNGIGDLGHPAR